MLVILLVVYRSPVVSALVLLSAGGAYVLATIVVYALAKNDMITLDGQAQGILSILVIGAATDYALLLVARYREELRRHDDRYEAMWLAWRRTLEPVAASAGTVIVGLLCLLLSGLGPTRSLGPVGAIGVASALLASLTFLPAVLVIPGRNSPGEHGRWVFWPLIPHLGSEKPETAGIWGRVARMVGTHPRRVWIATTVVLLALAGFLPDAQGRGGFPVGHVPDRGRVRHRRRGVGQALPERFGQPGDRDRPCGQGRRPGRRDHGGPRCAVRHGHRRPTDRRACLGIRAAAGSGSAARIRPAARPKVVDGKVQLLATLADPADSPAGGRHRADPAGASGRGQPRRAGRREHRDEPRPA